jgi:hypothetical protein
MIDPTLPSDALSTMLGDRNRTHGNPEDTLSRIAVLWSGYIGTDISAADVASMMTLLKLARARHGYSRDHYLDGIAYLVLAEGLSR